MLSKILTWISCILLCLACWYDRRFWFIGMIAFVAASMIFQLFKRQMKKVHPLTAICYVLFWPLYFPILINRHRERGGFRKKRVLSSDDEYEFVEF